MNAAPPVFQAQPSNDAVQPNAPTSAASATTRTGSQDFAAALSDAGGKPVRKSAANKQQDPASSGSSLPAPGNQPPLALGPPPPAKADAPAPAVADSAAAAKDPSGSAPGPVPDAIAAASAALVNGSGATTILSAANLDPVAAPAAAAPPAIAASPGLAAPQGTAAAPGIAAAPGTAAPPGFVVAPDISASSPAPADGVDATTVPGSSTSSMSMPHAASMRTLAAPGPSAAATDPAESNTGTAKSSGTSTNPATIASANSAPTSTGANALNDATLSNGPAAAGTDAAAQAVMAAAIVQGTSAPAPDTASSDDLAVPDTGVAQGAAAPSDPAAAAPAAALARAAAASISAAVTAATAASVTQALSDTASIGAADRRSHANSPDATVSGASNDGSIGAAQLLTSNTSTDSAPTPTFKVAAGVDTAQFGQGVADRVSLMMDGNLSSAKLQVNPPALGPIEVRIALQGGHAQVSFSSHSAVTRDALESSSEKLREMLGSQGFSSVSVDISQRSFQERSPPSQAYESAPSIGAAASVLAPASLPMSRSASGLLDAYA